MAQTASFREAASVAADSLRSSKLRSFLTLLGIILATTTLIAVMSIIHGMDVYIANSVSSMGSDGFRIVRMAFIGNFDPKKFLELQKKNPQLSPEEFAFLKEKATMVRDLGMGAGRGGSASYGTESMTDMGVSGGTANWAVLNNTELASGRYFTEAEDAHHVMVAVIGNDLKDHLFGGADPVGKTIKIDGRPFTVVGVAKAKGSVFGQSQDEIRMLLRAYRHLRPGQDENFAVISSDALVGAWDSLTGAIAATAIAIVSVFMVVGGVVIMNIMLAVVSERTHEIGIRKSVGARRQDILNQFLVESSMLAGIGGLMGTALAWIVAVLVRTITPVPMAVPASAVFIGVGLSMAVGLFFGIY